MIRSPIKWVGGKGKSVGTILDILPKQAEIYVEPFCGGFSVGLAYIQTAKPKHVIASDLNHELVNFWVQLQRNFTLLTRAIEFLESEHVKDPVKTFNAVRDDFNSAMDVESDELTDAHQAARFYYLNKCGFNGLYRVNRRGKFNVPRGDKVGTFADYENLGWVANLIQGVEFVHAGYTGLRLTKEVVAYCDPPYVPVSDTSNFTGYVSEGFDHQAFANWVRNSVDRGSFVAVSNSATPASEALFDGLKVVTSSRAGTINSKASSRGRVQELIFHT